MKSLAVAFLVIISSAVSAESFDLVCDVRPMANERLVTSRVYRVDTDKQTVDDYPAAFSEKAIVVEKPFLENGPYRDTPATYTFNRVSGRLEVISKRIGVASFVGTCQKNPLPKF